MNGVTDASKYMAVIAAELAGEARMSKDKPSPATKNPCSSESLLGPFLPNLVVPAVTKGDLTRPPRAIKYLSGIITD